MPGYAGGIGPAFSILQKILTYEMQDMYSDFTHSFPFPFHGKCRGARR